MLPCARRSREGNEERQASENRVNEECPSGRPLDKNLGEIGEIVAETFPGPFRRRPMLNASAIADFCTRHIRDMFRQTPILKQHVETCVRENMASIDKRLKEVEKDVSNLKTQVHVLPMEKCYMEMYIKDLQPVGEPFKLPNFDTLESMMPKLTTPCPTPAMQRPPPPPHVAQAIPMVLLSIWMFAPPHLAFAVVLSIQKVGQGPCECAQTL